MAYTLIYNQHGVVMDGIVKKYNFVGVWTILTTEARLLNEEMRGNTRNKGTCLFYL